MLAHPIDALNFKQDEKSPYALFKPAVFLPFIHRNLKLLLQSYKVQALTLVFIWIVAMLFSAEFLLSLAMILLVALAVFQLRIEGQQVQFGLRQNLQTIASRFWSNKAYLLVSIPFFIVLVTALWSGDFEYTLERLRIKLPFLVLPFAFAAIPRWSKRELLLILYFMVWVMTVACLYVGLNYLSDYQAINDLMGKGKPMPTPSNHIRFSLMLGLSVLAGAALYSEGFFLRYKWERFTVSGLTIFLFGFLHILSVRSGLVVLYLAILFLSMRHVYFTRRYLLGVAVALTLFSLPVLAYQVLPSFKMKIDYSYWDFMQYLQGKGHNYSDSDRLTSLEVGLKIGNEHPLLGVGAGDLKQEVSKLYAKNYEPGFPPKMPHNQFVSIYAGSGMVGLLVFLVGFFFPLFYRSNFRNTLFFALHVVIFFSFMMENTIENNFGISIYLLFLLLGLNYLDDQRVAETDSFLKERRKKPATIPNTNPPM